MDNGIGQRAEVGSSKMVNRYNGGQELMPRLVNKEAVRVGKSL